MPYRLSVRRFLNSPRYCGGADIFARVEDSSVSETKQDEFPLWTEITLKISDCNRIVSLDFDLDSASARRNSLKKADLLVETLGRFRDALREEAALAEARARSGSRKGRGDRAGLEAPAPS